MKTLIVGNALNVLPLAENIVSSNKEQQVTLFATEGVLPYDRTCLPAWVAAAVTESGLFKKGEAFLKSCPVTVVTSEVMARLSVRRKYLTTEKKTQIDYDRLMVLDTGNFILPEVKGSQKEGVFDCWQFTSVKALIKYLLLSDNVTVVVSSIQGLNMACALRQREKEVTIIAAKAGLLPDLLDEETGLLLKQILEGQGIRVFSDNAIEEVLGDAQVKAVKLKSGKVLACDMVVFDEVKPDMRMISEVPLPGEDKIYTEECFQLPKMPLAPASFGFNVINGFYAGYTQMPEGGREYLKFDSSQNVFKKIYVQGDHIAGIVLFNAPQDQERLWGILDRRESITGHEEEIL